MCAIDWQIIADLIQAIGSIGGLIALYFLYKTLKLQNQTLKEQQRLTDLEHKRYIESNSPNIVIAKIDYSSYDISESISITLRVKDNYLIDFRYDENLSRLGNKVLKQHDILNRNNTYNVSDKIIFEISRPKSPVIISVDGLLEGYGINIYYKDKFGHSFKQSLYYSGDKNIYISPAFRI